MKNLIVSNFSEFSSQCENCFCILNDERATYLVSPSNIYELVEGKVSSCFCLGDVELLEDELVAAALLSSLQLICCVTRDGSICLYNTSDCVSEVVGVVDGGLCEVAASPDDELVALVSGQLKLLIMDSQLQPIAEKSLVEDEAAKLSPVNVGWGSKETQFHGSAGKAAASDTGGAAVASTDARDPRRCGVVWRSDGLMLCVSYVCPQEDIRCYSIYSRDCQLLARAERVSGCSGCCVAWQPADARLISAALQLPSRQLQVVFYEKNGLRHGEFTFNHRPEEAFVSGLLWSPCSSVLAVWLQLNNSTHSAAVQLWTSSNYHWRMKKQLLFTAEENVTAISWHPETQLCLQVLSVSGRLSTLRLQSAVSVCESGWCAVLDSCRVLVSPLSSAVVPPPMSAQSLLLPAPVSSAVFSHRSQDCRTTRLYAITDTPAVYLFSTEAGEKRQQGEVEGVSVVTHVPVTEQLYLAGSWKLDRCERGNWCWAEAGEKTLVTCCLTGEQEKGEEGSDCSAVVYRLVDGESTAQLVKRVSLPSAMHLSVSAGEGSVLFQTADGNILLLSTADSTDGADGTDGPVSAWRGPDNRLPTGVTIKSPLVQMCVVGGDEMPVSRALLSLCSRRQLRLDNCVLLSSCSSFAVNDQFLLAITLDHRLHCVLLSRLLGGGWKNWSDISIVRTVERGALLVSAPAASTSVILQMPRGNLEIIHPRPLVLSLVGRLIDSGDYFAAYELMRRHRVNLNLLVDYNPDKFCLHCGDICREFSRQPNWLCVLLAELREEDVTQTMFREWFPVRTSVTAWKTVSPDTSTTSKVNSVCSVVRSNLEQQLDSSPQLLLPLITSWVCQQPSDVHSALQLILNIKEEPGEDKNGRISADAALRYLLYLVKPQRLYDEALGTYNFDLVLMVAERTDKDPKEYLPFLSELRELPVPYRHYRIDRHLRKHERALRHLADAGETHQREALQYIQQQSLYGTALRVYQPGTAGYKAVCALYADHLSASEKSCWEAAIYYKRAGVQMSAIDAFKRTLAWRECLQTATAAGLQREEYRALCQSLAESLSASGRHCDAAAIYERHLKLVDQQVRCLLEARSWLDAVLACQQAGKSSLLDSVVRPALLEAVCDMDRFFSEIREQFSSHVDRLEIVREKQAVLAAQLQDGVGDECDLYSDTSSVSGTTTSSGRSSRSSRSRRKQERKKYSLREGSASEDLALVVACHTLATRCYSLTEEVSSLLRALLSMALEVEMSRVQNRFAKLLTAVNDWCRKVWPPAPPQTPIADPELSRSYHALCDRLANLESVYRHAPAPIGLDTRWKLECGSAE